jgi:hypothetical protein
LCRLAHRCPTAPAGRPLHQRALPRSQTHLSCRVTNQKCVSPAHYNPTRPRDSRLRQLLWREGRAPARLSAAGRASCNCMARMLRAWCPCHLPSIHPCPPPPPGEDFCSYLSVERFMDALRIARLVAVHCSSASAKVCTSPRLRSGQRSLSSCRTIQGAPAAICSPLTASQTAKI